MSLVGKLLAAGQLSTTLHRPTIDVLDTAKLCKLWFQENDITPTAADIVAMTKLALEREQWIENKRDAADDAE
jgi:hypothetical protein